MVTYLDDAVEITPELKKLFQLIRDENSLRKSSQIVGINRERFWRILNEDRDKYVHEGHYQNAVNYFKDKGLDEEGLCELLEINSLEETFVFVKPSERKSLVEKANDYIASQEISKTEFISQLTEENPTIAHLSMSTFYNLLDGKFKPDLRALKAIKLFFKDKHLEPKEPVDYNEVMKMADSYMQSKGLTKNELTTELINYNNSIGSRTTINEWLSRRQEPKDPEKLRMIRRYIQINKSRPKLCGHLRGKGPNLKTAKIIYVPAKYARSLYYICLDAKVEPGFEFPAGETCPDSYGRRLEEKVIETYSKQQRPKLPARVLLNLFAPSLCHSTLELHKMFPKLYAHLTYNHKRDIFEIFAAALLSMADADLMLVADNFGIDVSRATPLIKRKEDMAYSIKKKDLGYHGYIQTAYNNLMVQIEVAREEIKNQVMKKIS